MGRSSKNPLIVDKCITLKASSYKCYLAKPGKHRLTTSWGEEASIFCFLDVTAGQAILTLSYTINANQGLKYSIQMEPIPSNLGTGNTWYFRCPRTGRRAKKLYFYKGVFQHRTAIEGAFYMSQVLSKKQRSIQRYYNRERALDLLTSPGFTPYYKGKLTKACKRVKNHFANGITCPTVMDYAYQLLAKRK